MNLIAEREGIEARAQKRWDKFLGEFGSVAFAIAPLYSTFLHQEDGVSCHPACLLMLHCLLSRCVVNGSIQLPQDRLWLLRDSIQLPQDRLWLLRDSIQLPQDRFWLLREIAQGALHYRNSPHAPPIETTPSWALARMYATPYCSPGRSLCFFSTTQPTSRALNVEFISVPCMLPVSVPRRHVWHCAIGECN